MDARLLPPEQVWRDRKEALFRQFVGGLADVGVHPEQLLQNDNGGSRRGLRSCDIGGERAVMSFYGDVIVHCVLLRRRRSSSRPPPMSSGSAEAHSRARRDQPAARTGLINSLFNIAGYRLTGAEVAASSIRLAV